MFFLSFISPTSKLIKPKERGLWKPLIYSQSVISAHVELLGWEDPLEKGMATHSSILAWRIPWTEETGGGSWGCEELDMTK